MAKIARKNQKQFGSTAGVNQIGIFGSFAAGSPAYTTDPETVQSLSNYLDGWFSGVLGDNSPAMEDMNALFFLAMYQLAYLFQAGVPEWNALTTYYIGSLVNVAGVEYVSLTDANLNNATTDQTNWAAKGSRFQTKTTTYTATLTDNFLRGDTTSGAFTITLPAAATSVAKQYNIKNVGVAGFNLTVKGNASENIDGSNTQVLAGLDSIALFCNGTSWDVI